MKYFLLLSGLLVLDLAQATDEPEPSDDPEVLSHCARDEIELSATDLCFYLKGDSKLSLFPEDSYPRMANGRAFIAKDLASQRDIELSPWRFYETDNPGWVTYPGSLADDERLFFNSWGTLRFWEPKDTPEAESWSTETLNGEKIRFFGATPSSVVLNGTDEELAYYQAGTFVNSQRIDGPLSAQLGTGVLHEHLDFCIETGDKDCTIPQERTTELVINPALGIPLPVVTWSNVEERHGDTAPGAYLIEFQVIAKKDSEEGREVEIYEASEPFGILFNHKLSDEDFRRAAQMLQTPTEDEKDEEALASTGILVLY
ncbi:MAG: hypothetical protein AAGB12_14485 [Pseudomonadota bacterium]